MTIRTCIGWLDGWLDGWIDGWVDNIMIPGYHVRKQKQILFLIHDVKTSITVTEECDLVSTTAQTD